MNANAETGLLIFPPAAAAVAFQKDAFLTKGLMGNRALQLQLIRNCVRRREPTVVPAPLLLTNADLQQFHCKAVGFHTFLQENQGFLPQTRKRLAAQYFYYIWKVARIPSAAKNICVLGCGPGFEIPFIRYLHPAARITAIDYRNSILPDIADGTKVHFIQGVLPDCLTDLTQTFDVIFSNHVMEHMIDPDRTFQECRRLLQDGGCLIAALPLDGCPETALHNTLLKELLSPNGPSLLNMGIVDLGHPWKTTRSDVHATAIAAGFANVTVTTRACTFDPKLNRVVDLTLKRRNRGERLYRLTFAPVKSLLNALFGTAHIPSLIQKIILRLESKVWFGGNNLKSSTAPEALVCAIKATAPKI